ncbi:MAG: hypothetical protein NTV46_20295 [Verrucomicrobia bacterium]|nr:hypothetical protein [Verrucomicrobiota bacterium]
MKPAMNSAMAAQQAGMVMGSEEKTKEDAPGRGAASNGGKKTMEHNSRAAGRAGDGDQIAGDDEGGMGGDEFAMGHGI